MITTVTTTTVTTATNAGLLAGLGLSAVLTLIAFLITRELLDAAAEQAEGSVELIGSGQAMPVYLWVRPLSQALGIGIVPLLFVFGVIVLVRVMAVLH